MRIQTIENWNKRSAKYFDCHSHIFTTDSNNVNGKESAVLSFCSSFFGQSSVFRHVNFDIRPFKMWFRLFMGHIKSMTISTRSTKYRLILYANNIFVWTMPACICQWTAIVLAYSNFESRSWLDNQDKRTFFLKENCFYRNSEKKMSKKTDSLQYRLRWSNS